ncbi:MAG: hypothetical protein R3236_01545, partial [Phycisphaeraceae bacterium]|nr:hypothetical protein [Phycisphaeraceae bacterium]
GGIGSYLPPLNHYRIGLQHGKVYCKQTRTTGGIYLICGNDERFQRTRTRAAGTASPPAPPRKTAHPCGRRRR